MMRGDFDMIIRIIHSVFKISLKIIMGHYYNWKLYGSPRCLIILNLYQIGFRTT